MQADITVVPACFLLLLCLLIARGPFAYRSWAACLSLVGRLLIARGPLAYRSWAACLSLVPRLLIAHVWRDAMQPIAHDYENYSTGLKDSVMIFFVTLHRII